MDFEILNASIVILAQNHNPTILHPSFLKAEKIVPSEWELAPGNDSVVCTPPISIVKYNNGLVFSVEFNKFKLVYNTPPEDFGASEVPEIAQNYIQALPKTRYTAVGVNIVSFIEHSSPDVFLIGQFLDSKVKEDKSRKPQALGLNLVYPVSQGTLRLSFDSATVKRSQDGIDRKGILVSANYHTDISPNNALEEAKKAIDLFSDRCSDFIEKVKTILRLEN